MRNKKIVISTIFTSMFIIFSLSAPVWAWTPGGFTDPGNTPKFCTHDWIALHAASWLPNDEKWWIMENRDQYLLGTELPDNNVHPLGINDRTLHHVYYNASGHLTNNPSAWRAYEEYNLTLAFLNDGNYSAAALHAGIMSHYISDLAVFAHVMGDGTDWGVEAHHSDYEDYVGPRTNEYPTDVFSDYLGYDGILKEWNAYDSALNLAYDTTFDLNGKLTCVWMDNNYNWDNTTFRDRAGESLNLCTNYITDVLHTLYINMKPKSAFRSFDALFKFKAENAVYFIPTGNIYDDSVLYAFYSYMENSQIITTPTQNPASKEFLDEDGKPIFTGNIVTFGGRVANRLVRYFEDAGTALVGYGGDSTYHIFTRISDGTPLFKIVKSTYIADEKDYFIFQIYRDGDRYVLSEWGIGAEGTYAGGLCFINQIGPNIEAFTNQYYIYSWTDFNNDDIPQPEEITLETSGS